MDYIKTIEEIVNIRILFNQNFDHPFDPLWIECNPYYGVKCQDWHIMCR